ncbi:MAG: hypothetical protein EXS05_16705 [Planctomycetaceae bacterium]|nr:hypothetical protein [Planctomycetaceae bacterium]
MTTAPSIIPVNPSGIPAELKAINQWVLWRNVVRDSKPTKEPYQLSGLLAATDDPSTWTTFDAAFAAYERGGFSGIGFVFAPGGGYVGIDFDGCRNPANGSIDYWALSSMEDFSSYAEVSPSGTGFKVFVKGELPTDKTGAKTGKHNQPPGMGYGGKKPGIEIYQRGRYFAVTGHRLPDAPASVISFNGELHEWFGRVFTPKPAPEAAKPVSTSAPSIDRAKLVDRAIAYLAKVPAAISGQRGHDAAFHAACVCRCGFGLSLGESFLALADWNAACVPPWSEAELRHKLEDAGKEPVTLDLLNADRRNGYQGDCQKTDPREYGIDLDDQPRDYERASDDDRHGDDKPRRPPVQRRTIGELVEEFPRLREPVIEGWVRRGETGNIISVSKIGKSWLVYYIAFSFVLRHMIFDRFATSGGRLLIIDNELHETTLASRMRTVVDAMGIEWGDVKDQIDVWTLRGNLRNVFELSVEFGDIPTGTYALIVFDAKYRMLGEDASENDNAAETRFYNEVDRLAEQTGAAILMVHHSTKGSQSDKRTTDVGAGAGAQSRAADCHLVLREHEEENCVVLDGAVRSFKPVEPLALRWEYPLWIVADDIDPSDLKGKRSEVDERQQQKDDEAQGEVIDAANGWKSRGQLKQATGLGYGRLDRACAQLLKSAHLESQEAPREGKRGPLTVTQYRKSIKARATKEATDDTF